MAFRFLFTTMLSLLACGRLPAQGPLDFASGSWFNPERNYEGFVVQVLPDNRAVVTWFTYPPEGQDGNQAWIMGVGEVDDNRIVIGEMAQPLGGVFGPDFDPETVVREPWGTLELVFTDCNTATGNYQGPAAFGSGELSLVRLSAIDDVACGAQAAPEPDRVIAGRSGLWYDPAHDGEGWMVEVLANGNGLVYWFTYDDQGRQAWLIGQAEIRGRTLWIEDMLITRGTHFGDAFNSEDVFLDSWGSFGFLFDDCLGGHARYDSLDPRFGEGALIPARLGFLAGTDCDEPPPVAPLNAGSWRLSTNMATAVSESGATTLQGLVYTAGGFGHLDRIQRFDPVTEAWQALPNMPGGRHHPMVTNDDQAVYVAGGFSGGAAGGGGPQRNFWRLDPDSGSWEILPDLPNAKGAGAAVFMLGRIWIVGGEGVGNNLQIYDIGTGSWGLLPGAPAGFGDHMQAVAFENEIWWIGGRAGNQTSTRVSIFNPVSQEWREGPNLFYSRSGLAAAVVQGQIMVTGGESLGGGAQLVPGMEIFSPGSESWVSGPEPPIVVHGVSGAAANGWFILTAGSTVAGSTSQNRATQIYTPAGN